MTFRCNDTRFHVRIEGVEVYAQGFAAVAADFSNYQGFNIVADIGNGTMNVIFIIDGKPDSSRYYTERFGVECCVIEMWSELTNKVHTVVDDCIVKKVLKDGTADIGEKYLKAIAECASDYTDKIMRKWREYGYNEELAKLHFLGGGAMLMKHFAKLDQNKVRFIEVSMPTPKDTNICPTRGCYGASGVDRGRVLWGKDRQLKISSACPAGSTWTCRRKEGRGRFYRAITRNRQTERSRFIPALS